MNILFKKQYRDMYGKKISMAIHIPEKLKKTAPYIRLIYKKKQADCAIKHDIKKELLYDLFYSMLTHFSEDENPASSAAAMYKKISTPYCPCCKRQFKTVRPLEQLESQLAYEKSKS